jgi:LacI family transcriptional regulator
LNNESNVSPETTSEVKKAISYLNYVPNLAARSLSRGKAMALGLVIGWKVTSAFSSMLIEAMLSESMQRDHSLVLFSSEREIINPVRDAFLGRRVDGIIMDSKAAENPELTYLLHTLNKPYVVIHPEHLNNHRRASFVRIDNYKGAREAAGYLVGLGHRSIGFISYSSEPIRENDRRGGYCAALEEAGIQLNPEWIYEGMTLPAQIGYNGVMSIFPRHEEVTAIFAATDEIAMGALTALWQLGKRIPQDVSVIGFDDNMNAASITPPLTTIHQPVEEIASSAIDIMIRMIDEPEFKMEDRILPTTLVVRESCQPPSHNGRPA